MKCGTLDPVNRIITHILITIYILSLTEDK